MDNNVFAVFAGYCLNNELLLKSTSGGVSAVLAYNTINNGGIVFGVAYSNDLYSAKYVRIDNLEDISLIQGSKYIRAELGNVFQQVKADLLTGKQVLFTGLPCNIAGLLLYLNAKYDNLITCELICDGPTYPEVQKQYVESLEKKYKSKAVKFSPRYKKCGWSTPYLHVEFENGKVFEDEFYATPFGYAFRIYGYPGCYSCNFKGDNRKGDIMIGDLWGAKQSDEFWNSNGLSLVLVRTQKGLDVLKGCDMLYLSEYSYDRAVERNKRILMPNKQPVNWSMFDITFKNKGLFAAVNATMPKKRKVKLLFKKLTPFFFRPLLQKMYRNKITRDNFT